jgi:hypothetical protein
MQWECGFLFPSRNTIQKVTPKNDALYTLTGSNTGANDFAFIFTSKGGTGPAPTPAGPDAASSCHVTITNDTKLTLTLGNQGHERGDFMTFPAKTLAPGASTTCVSVETPNAKDPKDEGCKGFLLWQVGSPKVLWRVEWDNPEGSKNIASAAFNPPNSGFFSLNQIGQGEENVPTSFTISGGGEQPPTSTGKLSVTVLDEATNQPLEGATVEVLDKSAKTDAAGKTVFTPPPGSHPIRATAEGFEENRGTVVMEPGKDVDHVLFMKKKDEPQPTFNPPRRMGRVPTEVVEQIPRRGDRAGGRSFRSKDLRRSQEVSRIDQAPVPGRWNRG